MSKKFRKKIKRAIRRAEWEEDQDFGIQLPSLTFSICFTIFIICLVLFLT